MVRAASMVSRSLGLKSKWMWRSPSLKCGKPYRLSTSSVDRMERRLEACVLVLGKAVLLQRRAQPAAEPVKVKWEWRDAAEMQTVAALPVISRANVRMTSLKPRRGYVFSSIGRFMFGPNYGNPSVVHGDGEDEFMYVVDLFNSRKIREAEIPSANGHASAYALAKVASIMANGGTAHGVTLLNSNTYELALSNPTVKYDNSLFTETKFVKGGWAVFDGKFAFGKYRHGFIGWFGLGGSVLQWRSDLKIGFGYTNTLMGAEIGNKHGALIQYEIVECTKRLKKKI